MRRRLLPLVALAAATVVAQAGSPVWVTSDAPADESFSGVTLLPWEIYRYDSVAGYSLELSVPGQPDLNAIHRLDHSGDWLFSVDAPSDLGGALLPAGTFAEPRDLIYYDTAGASYKVCFSGAAAGLPPGADIDAVVMEGGDASCAAGGTLLISFDAPTEIPPFVGASAFEPSDLVRFRPLAPGVCPGWTLDLANPAFDGSAAGTGIQLSSVTEGADRATDFTSGTITNVLALDVPSDVGPPASTYLPGQLISTDSATFSLFEPLLGWPGSGLVDGISCGGNPGRVPTTMVMDKPGAPGDVLIDWQPSCSGGADDYAIYEGTIGTWYDHTLNVCTDVAPAFTEQVTPSAAGDRYFLVVAQSGCRGEGSYGSCQSGVCLPGDERPVGTATCTTPHVVTCCP